MVRKITKYAASDGREFDDEASARAHERELREAAVLREVADRIRTEYPDETLEIALRFEKDNLLRAFRAMTEGQLYYAFRELTANAAFERLEELEGVLEEVLGRIFADYFEEGE